MKKILLMLVVLITSMANAQTFNFDCDDITPFQSELNDLYSATAAPPTGFVSGGVIETEALAQGGASASVIETFMQKLLPENFSILPIYTNIPVNVTVIKGQNNKIVESPYNITVGNHTGPQIRDWALDVVQAIWNLEYPAYAEAQALAAKRVERLAQVGRLDDNNPNANIIHKTTEQGFDYFSINEEFVFELYTYETGATKIENMLQPKWNDLVTAITNKVAELTPTIAEELTTILDDRVNEPSSLLSAITNAANATQGDHGGGTYVNRQNFLKGFTYQSVTVNFTGGNPSSASITDGSTTLTNVITDFGSPNLSLLTQPQFINYTLGVVKKMWEILPQRQDVLDEIYALGVNGVNITLLSSDPDRFEVAGVSSSETVQASRNVEYFSNEELDDLKDDIITERNKLLPTGTEAIVALINERALSPFPDYDTYDNHDNGEFTTTSTFGASPNLVSYILSITGGQARVDFILSLGTNTNFVGASDVSSTRKTDSYFTFSRAQQVNGEGYNDRGVNWQSDSYFAGTTTNATDLRAYGWLKFAIDAIGERWYLTSEANDYESRKQHMTNYASNTRSWGTHEETHTNDAHYYYPVWYSFGIPHIVDNFGTLIVSNYQNSALHLGQLNYTAWTTMWNEWVQKINDTP